MGMGDEGNRRVLFSFLRSTLEVEERGGKSQDWKGNSQVEADNSTEGRPAWEGGGEHRLL